MSGSFAYTVRVNTIRFGTDGWRGVIADDFTFENVRKVAFAIARYIVRAEKPGQGVIVGYDNRVGSDRFAQAVAETIAMAGVPVWLSTSPCPSPAVSLLVRQREAAGGVMITASHNPYRWNGIKFKASYGSSALPSIVEQIEQELATVQVHGLPILPPRPREIHSLDLLAPYLDTIDKLVDWEKLQAARLRFVVDPMHGSARGLLISLMRRHGVACDEIRGSRDPLFGGVNPEPIEPHIAALRETYAESIAALVPKQLLSEFAYGYEIVPESCQIRYNILARRLGVKIRNRLRRL